MKLRTRIMLLFLACIIITMTLSLLASAYFGRRDYIDEVYEASGRTLQAVSENIELTMKHIRQDADAVFWNAVVQEKLEELKSAPMSPELRTAINETIAPILLSDDAISSVLFYDNFGNCCYSLRDGVLLKSDTPVRDAYWYADVLSADGEWLYETDGGGIIGYADDNRNTVSMLRTVKSRTDYAVCGIIMVNVDEKTIRSRFDAVEGAEFYILSGRAVVFGPAGGGALPPHIEEVYGLPAGSRTTVADDGRTLLYQKLSLAEGGWAIVSETAITSGWNVDIGLTAVVLLGNVALLLVCWLFVYRRLSRPLKEMETHIGASGEIPADFELKAGKTDEIGALKAAYNRMLASVRELVKRTCEEEKSIQKGELELVLSQVSPHFLYNTLDTISGMILSGDEQQSFKLVQALGSFYRSSLGSGRQTVTLGEELGTVRSYIEILNTRYGESVHAVYRVPKELVATRVLKLMLQPLAENAVHHGIRPKGAEGEVVISAEADGEELVLSVYDDGVGMPQEKISEILCSTAEKSPGFGIFSIRRRIALFYGASDPLTIESSEGEWTRVTLRIPRSAPDEPER